MLFKRGLYCILFCLLCKILPAQVVCDSGDNVSPYGSDSLLTKSLDTWMSEGHYDRLLKKHGIGKLSCATCTAAYVDLSFTIGKDGKIIPVRVHRTRICDKRAGRKFLNDLYQSLGRITVPLPYAGGCYRYRFGRALKC